METCTAFHGTTRIASGFLRDVVVEIKKFTEIDRRVEVLIFDDATGEPVDVDLRGTTAQALARLARPQDGPDAASERGPGRPKLGVIAREVTLLPRHWNWLASQPGGASVALRKLVEHAIKENQEEDRVRRAKESAYRFMTAMAGNRPGYEEAIRALFAGRVRAFERAVEGWPADILEHAHKLALPAFTTEKNE